MSAEQSLASKTSWNFLTLCRNTVVRHPLVNYSFVGPHLIYFLGGSSTPPRSSATSPRTPSSLTRPTPWPSTSPSLRWTTAVSSAGESTASGYRHSHVSSLSSLQVNLLHLLSHFAHPVGEYTTMYDKNELSVTSHDYIWQQGQCVSNIHIHLLRPDLVRGIKHR